MKAKNSIGNRIRIARNLRSMSMDDVVRRCGNAISKMAISKYERGIIIPKESSLKLISEACCLPMSFFQQASINITRVSFRLKKDKIVPVEESIINKAISLLEEYTEAENYTHSFIPFQNPIKKKDIDSYEDVEKTATLLRKKWELASQPIVSVYELLESHGIKVLEFYNENEHINGLSFYTNNKTPFMLINTYTNNTLERKRFTALHELAHLLLHIKQKEDSTINEERIANRFAGALLFPQDIAIKRFGNLRPSVNMKELISVRNLYGISIAALTHRLFDLQIINKQYYDYMFDYFINLNPLEKEWGCYQINEVADRLDLLKSRLTIE